MNFKIVMRRENMKHEGHHFYLTCMIGSLNRPWNSFLYIFEKEKGDWDNFTSTNNCTYDIIHIHFVKSRVYMLGPGSWNYFSFLSWDWNLFKTSFQILFTTLDHWALKKPQNPSFRHSVGLGLQILFFHFHNGLVEPYII